MMRSFWLLLPVLLLLLGALADIDNTEKARLSRGTKYSASYRTTEYTRSARSYVFRSAVRANVIKNPSLPIKYNDVNYYWYGRYSYDASRPQKCEYVFDEADLTALNATLPDGSKPPSIQYGCLSFEECCGMECCGDSRTSTLFILGLICILMAIFLAYNKYRAIVARRDPDQIPIVRKNPEVQVTPV
ncbi:unnamed protein product [Caenorhabditis sp. 36 PRJEB53466]|nr:unnamed protein product [Caenorhabditis sp. 36 PRJEB53466]